ncbi:MAG TPA: hypothetical protein VFU67_04620 [Nitrososphaeraceae archaeon]|nr:hypothetical protein [Nitrososphaeraceae archaeon]
MTRLSVGGILYGLLGSTTFVVSGGVIFVISLLSFRLKNDIVYAFDGIRFPASRYSLVLKIAY